MCDDPQVEQSVGDAAGVITGREIHGSKYDVAIACGAGVESDSVGIAGRDGKEEEAYYWC